MALGGGGYEPVQVVPRAWTHLLAEVTGAPVDGATPGDWRAQAHERGGEQAPTSLTDGVQVAWEAWTPDPLEGLDAPHGASRLDRMVAEAVRETREAVFPALGLDPLRA